MTLLTRRLRIRFLGRGRVLTMVLGLSQCLLTALAPAQFPDGLSLTNEIRNARVRLGRDRHDLPGFELDRLAEFMGRSNYLAQALVTALRVNNLTNAEEALRLFPGKLDDVRDFGQPLLYRAAMGGNERQLVFLLERGANPDLPAMNGETPLAAAIAARHWPGALRLVQAGASMNRPNPQGQAPLAQLLHGWFRSPALDERTGLLSSMLDHGANPFSPINDDAARSILEEVLVASENDLAEQLLSYHPSPDRRAPNGDTALHLAARWGLTNAIAFLLNAGFSPDLTNADGLTPLQAIAGAADDAAGQRLWAARSFRGSPPGVLPQTVDEAADFLLSRGATLDVFCAAGLGRNVDLEAMLRTNRALVNARDGLGRTPLHYAVARSSQLSISGIRGAALVLGPPSARSNQTATALRLLRAHANPAAATLRSIPSLHRDEIAPAGTTPLHFAARLGNEDLIRALLEAGAPAASMDQAGETPLHAAARLWLTNGAARLLSAHAPLNVANHAGRTPLRIAVESRGAAMAQVLLDAGASPDVGLEHDTLAHLAAENGDTATLAVLLAHGLRLEARDWTGATPFQRAAVAHQCDTLAWLRARGADVNATDLRGNTALHLLAADAFDIVQHQAAQPWWVRWMRHSLTGPGITGKALIALINAKILSPPPPPVWTNSSLSSWLIAHRANPSMANDAGQTPLHLLCGQPWAANNPAVVSNRLSILLQAGARLDQADAQGRTPIQIATSNLPPELAQWLLFRAGNRQEEKPR